MLILESLREKLAWNGEKRLTNEELKMFVDECKTHNITKTAAWYKLKAEGFSIDRPRLERFW